MHAMAAEFAHGQRQETALAHALMKSSSDPRDRHSTRSGVRQLAPKFSPEREPWRWLQSSLAIQFFSKRPGGWCPSRLTECTRADVLSALEARWSAHVQYAALQSEMFDVLWFARKCKDYSEFANSNPTTKTEKRNLLRRMALARGPISSSRSEILHVLSWLDAFEPSLEVLCEGFVEVNEARSSTILIKLIGRRKSEKLSCDDVRARALEACRDLQLATDLVRKVKKNVETAH